ncbi:MULTISPECIES: OmpP1/FadL family transporter [unclassified Mesorhizobium]|uniref:OmpP1/FadL family transporter n=1 Tax=unclassified Mesorhizobium TaxID=325217 RepID=UPI0003CF43C3|nr:MULTISPECIES: OmpP1/FadL family transporter [unclassified Mesorhizobium]ESY10236.1 long-chain fatty acid transporter [Mesorhizobium sp. LNJC398B00]ESY36346.1 long-chain fatty acid transporter [Mesorhizobium sp. LNJC386A00]ESY49278.1 long-chain fatty acid transporter [Mesorhizobium sp. LNJC380A00]ESY57498.1 long-chain fatty acid transporter [Mesorhizobium sp. LNJC374B00]ESY60197.1 long-chain fatty acid transporter [Mesorhizobium sp. LNJC372A00]
MNNLRLKTLLGAGCFSLGLIGSVHAGGLERGGYDIDLLFDPAQVTGEVTGTYVMPQRDLKNVVDIDPNPVTGGGNLNALGFSNSARDTESYWVPSVGIKAGMGPVDCLIDYGQPIGAYSNPGANWAGANGNIITKVKSEAVGGTCSYKMDLGKGQVRFIGGVFHEDVSGFKEQLVSPFVGPLGLSGIGRLDLEGDGWGWRAGVAYEIPDIALRASLVYNSAVKLDHLDGTLDLTQLPAVGPANPFLGNVTNVSGSSEVPESLELKLQSGIAPGWLAFGSIKWVNWSVLQSIPFCPTGVPSCTTTSALRLTSLDLLYRDGWTVSGGIGHKFNDQWSGAAGLTWDRGTSTGLSAQTDTWTVSGGVSYTPTANVELRLGGALGVLTSGSIHPVVGKDGVTYGTDYTADFGNDLVSAVSTSFKVKW